MASNDNDDDWEKAEANLKTLDIQEKLNKDQNPPISLASKFIGGGDQTSNSAVTETGHSMGNRTANSSTSMGGYDEVDSAIKSAMNNNPRERMALLQIENTILNFINSNNRTLDIPPGYNSFRRLLSYRVGQRFGLSHTTSDLLNENGERGIVLYKTPNSGMPEMLLIDMKNDHQGGGDTNENHADSPSYSSLSRSDGTSPEPDVVARPPRKVMAIQKRKPNVNNSGSGDSSKGANSSAKYKQSAEDREKAYLEARARIFGDATSTDGTDINEKSSVIATDGDQKVQNDVAADINNTFTGNGTISPPINAAGIAVTNNNSSNVKQSDCSNQGKNNLSENGLGSTTEPDTGYSDVNNSSNNIKGEKVSPITAATDVATASVDPKTANEVNVKSKNSNGSQKQQNYQKGEGKSKKKHVVQDVTTWKENKCQVRNFSAEIADPDFKRRGTGGNNSNNCNIHAHISNKMAPGPQFQGGRSQIPNSSSTGSLSSDIGGSGSLNSSRHGGGAEGSNNATNVGNHGSMYMNPHGNGTVGYMSVNHNMQPYMQTQQAQHANASSFLQAPAPPPPFQSAMVPGPEIPSQQLRHLQQMHQFQQIQQMQHMQQMQQMQQMHQLQQLQQMQHLPQQHGQNQAQGQGQGLMPLPDQPFASNFDNMVSASGQRPKQQQHQRITANQNDDFPPLG